MSLADQLLAQLLPPCPLCSYRKADHPELDRDYLRMPAAAQGRAGKRWFLRDGCHHSASLPGNALGYDSQEQAETAWRTEAQRLACADTNATAALVASANRTVHERAVTEAQERAQLEVNRERAALALAQPSARLSQAASTQAANVSPNLRAAAT